ncbi:class A beta-lactamase [Streptomyces physcomitrii]|uniref:Beta-lactamase n=1 Tax=Streptomyces physcomitrii TaxID=2724184 RepID=A0ABX1H3S5_9ACTN|nr:class A beta-lactamase [Streptomyces physcomitrii]NKI43014.1 class A beta-lactamase [Streptomyces physcomitrii]
MTSSPPALGRRAFLGAAALLPLAPLAGCAEESAPASSAPSPSSPSSGSPGEERQHKQRVRLMALERKFGARLGLYALDTGTGATIAHRPDERFAFCSAFKALAAAAVLDRNPLSHLDTLVRYTEDDLMKHAPVTARHLDSGMTIRQLCDAAVRFSDGTAGNLLLRDLGGPAELTAYARGLGDRVTRMDRTEPAITEATPGDPRDTSSPRAFGTSYRKILLGGALPTAKRAFLRDLLERNTTGARRIRAGVPRGWTVADKTGTGDYGTLNDIAVLYPPKSAPLLLALMSSKPAEDAAHQEELLAEATAYAVTVLT